MIQCVLAIHCFRYSHRKQLFETGTPQVCELRMLRTDAAPFWVRIDATAAQDGLSGDPVCRTVVSDITDRKRSEETLRKSAERTKLFAYSVSHDLKSPVIGLYGLTKRLQQVYADVLGEKGKTYCDQILKSGWITRTVTGFISFP